MSDSKKSRKKTVPAQTKKRTSVLTPKSKDVPSPAPKSSTSSVSTPAPSSSLSSGTPADSPSFSTPLSDEPLSPTPKFPILPPKFSTLPVISDIQKYTNQLSFFFDEYRQFVDDYTSQNDRPSSITDFSLNTFIKKKISNGESINFMELSNFIENVNTPQFEDKNMLLISLPIFFTSSIIPIIVRNFAGLFASSVLWPLSKGDFADAVFASLPDNDKTDNSIWKRNNFELICPDYFYVLVANRISYFEASSNKLILNIWSNLISADLPVPIKILSKTNSILTSEILAKDPPPSDITTLKFDHTTLLLKPKPTNYENKPSFGYYEWNPNMKLFVIYLHEKNPFSSLSTSANIPNNQPTTSPEATSSSFTPVSSSSTEGIQKTDENTSTIDLFTIPPKILNSTSDFLKIFIIDQFYQFRISLLNVPDVKPDSTKTLNTQPSNRAGTLLTIDQTFIEGEGNGIQLEHSHQTWLTVTKNILTSSLSKYLNGKIRSNKKNLPASGILNYSSFYMISHGFYRNMSKNLKLSIRDVIYKQSNQNEKYSKDFHNIFKKYLSDTFDAKDFNFLLNLFHPMAEIISTNQNLFDLVVFDTIDEFRKKIEKVTSLLPSGAKNISLVINQELKFTTTFNYNSMSEFVGYLKNSAPLLAKYYKDRIYSTSVQIDASLIPRQPSSSASSNVKVPTDFKLSFVSPGTIIGKLNGVMGINSTPTEQGFKIEFNENDFKDLTKTSTAIQDWYNDQFGNNFIFFDGSDYGNWCYHINDYTKVLHLRKTFISELAKQISDMEGFKTTFVRLFGMKHLTPNVALLPVFDPIKIEWNIFLITTQFIFNGEELAIDWKKTNLRLPVQDISKPKDSFLLEYEKQLLLTDMSYLVNLLSMYEIDINNRLRFTEKEEFKGLLASITNAITKKNTTLLTQQDIGYVYSLLSMLQKLRAGNEILLESIDSNLTKIRESKLLDVDISTNPPYDKNDLILDENMN